MTFVNPKVSPRRLENTMREIRVKPVVRYLITDYDGRSTPVGEFQSVSIANNVASALCYQARVQAGQLVEFEPARALRIDPVRGSNFPHRAIRWELREVADA